MLKPFFSIIIPTLNEENFLPFLLKDLMRQTFKNFEVIHIDGQSEDKTIVLAQQFNSKIKIQSFIVKKRNVSFQRNIGAEKAVGSWLIFMDADDRLPINFLQLINSKLIKKPKIDLFSTYIKIKEKNLAFKAFAEIINLQIDLSNILNLKPRALGSMIGIKKELFKKIKFSEKNKICEDAFFIAQAKKQNLKFIIFKTPKYYYSLRRLHKEGILKMLKIITKIQIYYTKGSKFESYDCGYKMKGGSYYK